MLREIVKFFAGMDSGTKFNDIIRAVDIVDLSHPFTLYTAWFRRTVLVRLLLRSFHLEKSARHVQREYTKVRKSDGIHQPVSLNF